MSPITHVFDDDHYFLAQATTFVIGLLAAHSMSNLVRIRKQIADADAAGMFKRERFEEALRTGKKIELTLDLELADEIQIAGKVVHSGIKNPDALLETVLRFGATIDRLDVFELDKKPVPKVTKPGRAPASFHNAAIAQVCVGFAYESVKDRLHHAYGSDPLQWDPMLQYFRHLRNAASHRNRFRIDPRRRGKEVTPGIDPKQPPTWRSSVMPDDTTMNGLIAFFDFVGPGDILILLADIDAKLLSDGLKPGQGN